ncbi:MAG: HAD family hydrolase [Planctomycetales bacterium]|nr:HAD family hydrolase [Planctomycetales bacterium]
MTVLLFDIDGTLIDAAGAGGAALLAALWHEFNVSDPRPVQLHGRTDAGIVRELLLNHGVAATAENIQRIFSAYYKLLPAELVERAGTVLPGVQALLERLMTKPDCWVGLLTGNMPLSARLKLEHYGLWHYFRAGTYGDQALNRPELRDAALQMAGNMVGQPITGERVVVIGDTPLDIQLANAMQSKCLAVCTGGFDQLALRQAGATWVVPDLANTDEILQLLGSCIECKHPMKLANGTGE